MAKAFSVARVFGPIAEAIKVLIRQLSYSYLDQRNLSASEAQLWADRFKKWPAIYAKKPYYKLVDIGFGLTVKAGLIDVIQRSLVTDGVWDKKVLSQLYTYLKRGSTFIDIGANIGYFSLLASHLVADEGIVLAVEPSRRALSRLASNVQRNNLSNILIWSLAGGKDYSIRNLLQATPNNIGATSLISHVTPFAVESVSIIPLDALFLALEIKPDVIKIDVEGFEYEILCGMKSTLGKYRPLVICEITNEWLENTGCSFSIILEFMQALGYEAFTIDDNKSYTLSSLNSSTISNFSFQEEIVFIGNSK